MKLKEYEAQSLLHNTEVVFPSSVVVKAEDVGHVAHRVVVLPEKGVIKAQTLAKRRMKAGLVKKYELREEVLAILQDMFTRQHAGECVNEAIVSEFVPHEDEYYVAFTFDSLVRGPVLLLGKRGGVHVELYAQERKGSVSVTPINSVSGISSDEALRIVSAAGIEQNKEMLASCLCSLYVCFVKYDMRMLEINPFTIRQDGAMTALDCAVELDDAALARQTFSFPRRAGTRELTEREKAARAIDEEDYRGNAGKSYLELEGDIAVLASGGGASLTAMDALISYGGKPANYAEYSGNPPAEKIKRLTQIALSKEQLAGCFVVGGTANFTDIYETLRGFAEGVKALKELPHYPIVIRRAGPRDKEAFAMLHAFAAESGVELHLYDDTMPMSESARIMVELAENYRSKHGDSH